MTGAGDFTVLDVARATGATLALGAAQGAAGSAAARERGVTGATLDSRRVRQGQVFVPLAGSRTDGHAFVPQAVIAGAVAALCAVDRREAVESACRAAGGAAAGAALLVVENVEAALTTWAHARRDAWAGDLVGLVGSNGKTTTKEMLAAIFSQRAPTGRTEGNLNNQLGVPVTLTRLAARERYAVVEIGMNHSGEVRALSQLARPSAAVITNVGPEHLEGLGTLDAVARAEAEIGEVLRPGAPLVVPGDDPRIEACVRAFPAKKVTFALVPGYDFVASAIESRGEAGMRFSVMGFPPLAIPVAGRHSVRNALAAIACATTLGLSPGECAAGLATMTRPAGRMEIARWGGVTVLLDHYNANPASVDAGLETLEAWPDARRRYAALGDMLELGAAAADYHAALGPRLARLDGAYLWGPLMENAGRTAHGAGAGQRVTHFASRADLGRALVAVVQPGDVVLVKGSRGSAMEDVIAVLQKALAAPTAAAGEGR